MEISFHIMIVYCSDSIFNISNCFSLQFDIFVIALKCLRSHFWGVNTIFSLCECKFVDVSNYIEFSLELGHATLHRASPSRLPLIAGALFRVYSHNTKLFAFFATRLLSQFSQWLSMNHQSNSGMHSRGNLFGIIF